MKRVFCSSNLKVGFAGAFFLSIALSLISCTSKKNNLANELRIASANLKGLDPVATGDETSSNVIALLYDTLFQYQYLKRPLTIEPNLADGMPQVSKDGLVHTIKIKKGIFFSDDASFSGGKGRELVSQDFVYSWKRLCDPRLASEGFWLFDGKVEGLDDWRKAVQKDGKNFDAPVPGFQTPDSSTIVIKLSRPFYQLHNILAMVYTAPVPKEAVDKYGKEMVNHAVGTGPFRLESWTRNSQISLVKNPHYHGVYPSVGDTGDAEKGRLAMAGQKIPFVDRLIFYEIVEDQPIWLKFLKGDTDITAIPKDNFDAAIKNKDVAPDLAAKGVKLDRAPGYDLTYTSFNMLDPLFKNNVNLRYAVAQAQDTKTTIEKFQNGRGIEAQSIIPPELESYDPNFKNARLEFKVEKAKEYLAIAGYPGGKGLPELEYMVTNSSTARQGAELFQTDLGRLGIKVKISAVSWPQFLERLRDRKFQVTGAAWVADYPDAENFLALLYSKNASPGPNNSNFSNPEFDKLFEQAARTPPGPARNALYQKMRDISAEQLPIIPSTHREGYSLYHGWVTNYKANSVIVDRFKYVQIDVPKRTQLKEKL